MLGMNRVHADSVDSARKTPTPLVASFKNAGSQPFRNRPVRPKLLGFVEPVRDVVHGKDPAGAELPGISTAKRPTGPQPKTATVSPERISALSAP